MDPKLQILRRELLNSFTKASIVGHRMSDQRTTGELPAVVVSDDDSEDEIPQKEEVKKDKKP